MKEKYPDKVELNLPIWKKIIFSLVVLTVVFLALELGLRLLLKPESRFLADPYVSFSGSAPLFIEAKDPGTGSAIMKTAPYKLLFFQDQQFPAKKAKDTFRIFSMGGSTTYGRPYNDQTSFSGWLRETLPVADPTKAWEVINAGGISYASYRVASLMEELARYEPDLFIVYTGQNEFLEQRSYADSSIPEQTVKRANQFLSHSSIYRLIKKGVDLATGKQARPGREETLLPEEVETILENSIGPANYHRDDSHKLKASEHFRRNLDRMIAIAHSVGAKIAFIKPASNLKDCSPFKSESREGLSLQETRRWEALLDQARAQAQAEEWNIALETLDSASAIDDRQADLHYLKGTILYQSGKYAGAKESFERALEEDVCPLRAIHAIGTAVEAATAESDAMLVDFEELVSTESPHQITGQEIFIDHVHPTIEGNRLLSILILETLSENQILSYADDWKGDISLVEIKRKVESRLDPLFHGRALRNLARIYRWAGKFDEGYHLAKQALQHLPKDPETLYLIGSNALDTGRFEEAIQNLKESLIGSGDAEQAMILKNLGNAYLALGQWDDEIAAYKRLIDLGPNYLESTSNLALALHRKGDYEAAIAQYRVALKAQPDDAETMSNLGSLYLNTNQIEQAQEILEQAHEQDPYLFEAVFNLALVAIHSDRKEEAIQQLQEAIIIRPDSYEAHLELGDLLRASGKIKEAAKTFHQAIKIEPKAADAYYFAALLLAQEGKIEDARYLSQEATKRNPNWTDAAGLTAELALAREFFSESEKREALSLAQDAARLSNKQDPKIFATLTRAYLINGQTDQARTTALLAKENAERLEMASLVERIETQFAMLLEEEAP